MNQPKELMFVLGRNHLGFLLDQERKHWLLKTDKKARLPEDKNLKNEVDTIFNNIDSDKNNNFKKMKLSTSILICISILLVFNEFNYIEAKKIILQVVFVKKNY